MRSVFMIACMFFGAQGASAQPLNPDGDRWLIEQTASQAVDRIRPIATACACEARSARWCQLAILRNQGDAEKRAAQYTRTDALKAYAAAVLPATIGVAFSVATLQAQDYREFVCRPGGRWQTDLKAWDDALLNGTAAPGSP